MNFPAPWTPYAGRTAVISAGRTSLTSAFADLVRLRRGFEAYEFIEIWEAVSDEGENDACRDLVRIDGELMAEQFVHGRIPTFARPISGGDVVSVNASLWEIDDPLPRFATGTLSLTDWVDPAAAPTHRLFVDTEEFERWLVRQSSPGPLNQQQLETALDPRARAAKSIARTPSASTSGPEIAADVAEAATAREHFSAFSELLDLKATIHLTTLKRSTIYAYMNQGKFPKNFDLGGGTVRWLKSEVLAWISERTQQRRG